MVCLFLHGLHMLYTQYNSFAAFGQPDNQDTLMQISFQNYCSGVRTKAANTASESGSAQRRFLIPKAA